MGFIEGDYDIPGPKNQVDPIPPGEEDNGMSAGDYNLIRDALYDLKSGVAAGSSDIYGDGADDSVTFDGVATVLGMMPSANVYSMTRDLFLINCTISSGVTLKTMGYRIFGRGTLTLAGTISDAGANGGNAAANVKGTGGAGRSAGYFASTASGGNGGQESFSPTAGANVNPTFTGGANTGGAAQGDTATGAVGAAGNPGTGRYKGGGGGAGGANAVDGVGTASEAGGAVTASPESYGARPNQYQVAVDGTSTKDISNPMFCGSGGGGGGAGYWGSIPNTLGAGGGGGAGGGHLFIAYRYIAGAGTITANGGNGGNGGDATNNGGGGGGGAGGGGGNACVYTQTSRASLTVTVTAAGGTGGSGGNGSGTGRNGGAGGAGGDGVASVNAP